MYLKKCKNLLGLSWRFCHNCFYKAYVFLLFCLVIHIYIHCCTVFSFQKLMYNWNNIMFDHKLVSFDVKSLFTSIPLQLALDCTENAIKNSTVELPLLTDDVMDLLKAHVWLRRTFSTTANTTNSYTVQLWALQFLSPSLGWRHIQCCTQKWNRRFSRTP